MVNFNKVSVGLDARTELHDKLSLTGAEISINNLPAGACVPFVHAHKQNEEIYAIIAGTGKAVIDGTSGYYVAEEYNSQVIGTFMPSSEYYAGRLNQTVVVSLSMLIIFGVLLLMINRMVDNKIVQGINRISNSMSKIAGGDFEITVNEQDNPEFSMLSDSIR